MGNPPNAGNPVNVQYVLNPNGVPIGKSLQQPSKENMGDCTKCSDVGWDHWDGSQNAQWGNGDVTTTYADAELTRLVRTDKYLHHKCDLVEGRKLPRRPCPTHGGCCKDDYLLGLV